MNRITETNVILHFEDVKRMIRGTEVLNPTYEFQNKWSRFGEIINDKWVWFSDTSVYNYYTAEELFKKYKEILKWLV